MSATATESGGFDQPEAAPSGLTHDQRTAALKSDITTLGGRVDSYKAKTAGALGGGVFLLLLAAGGMYDLLNHNDSLRSAIGASAGVFQAVVIALSVIGLLLMLTAVFREIRRDPSHQLRLEQLERELADHLDSCAALESPE